MTFNGITFENLRPLIYYNIQDQSTIKLTLNESNKITIGIQKVDDTYMFINCNTSDTIQIIKNKIRFEEGKPIDQQVLIFNGVLEDDKTLNDCRISDGSTLVLIYLDAHLKIQISIKNSRNQITFYDCLASDKIKSLKEKIETKEGITADCQKLMFFGELLVESKVLNDYRIQNGSIIELVLRQKSKT